jgi:hypothetical protein
MRSMLGSSPGADSAETGPIQSDFEANDTSTCADVKTSDPLFDGMGLQHFSQPLSEEICGEGLL